MSHKSKKEKKVKNLTGCWAGMYERYRFNDFDGQGLTPVQSRVNKMLFDWLADKELCCTCPSTDVAERYMVDLLARANKEHALDGVDPSVLRTSALDGALSELTILTVKEIKENKGDFFLNVHAIISTERLTELEVSCLETCFGAEYSEEFDAITFLAISVPICNEINENKKERLQDFCVRKTREILHRHLLLENNADTGFRYGLKNRILDYITQVTI